MNAALEKICHSREKFHLLKREWYGFEGIESERYDGIVLKNA